MNLSDKEVLVVFSETIIRSKSKEKGKGRGWGKYFKKIIEQGVYHNLLQEMRVNDKESYFRLFVNELLANVMKKNVRP